MKVSSQALLISPVICAMITVACARDATTAPSSTTGSTTPPAAATPVAVPTKLFPVSPLVQSGWAGFPVPVMPAVEVYDQNGKPLLGAQVTFTYTKQNGSIRASTASTNLSGTAYTGWTLRVDAEQDTVVASLGALPSIVFIADAKRESISATFDLQKIGGRGLPITYSGGESSWSVQGGQYILAADGTYAWGYQIDETSNVRPLGRYTFVDPNTVKFYLTPGTYGPFYEQRNGLFATGVIEGDQMTVTYEDFVDFEVELYTRSPGAAH